MKESGIKSTRVVIVWEVPERPLSTLIILRFGNTFNTFKVSVPIPILLPIDTDFGNWVTYISVVAAPGEASEPTIGDKRLE